jgi:hypothetical protein
MTPKAALELFLMGEMMARGMPFWELSLVVEFKDRPPVKIAGLTLMFEDVDPA